MPARLAPTAFGVLAAALLAPDGRAQAPPINAAPSSGIPSLADRPSPPRDPPPVEQLRPRRGGPPRVACWACSSNTRAYVGAYVGGGSASRCLGQLPFYGEGVWGWDYQGCLVPHRVVLRWWHGCRQGGTGSYRFDGPNLLHRNHTEQCNPP